MNFNPHPLDAPPPSDAALPSNANGPRPQRAHYAYEFVVYMQQRGEGKMPAKRARCTHCQGDWAYNETRLKSHIIDPQRGCPKVPEAIRRRVREESMDGRTGGSLSYSGSRLCIDPVRSSAATASRSPSQTVDASKSVSAAQPARSQNGPVNGSQQTALPASVPPPAPSSTEKRAGQSRNAPHGSRLRHTAEHERTPMQGRTSTPSGPPTQQGISAGAADPPQERQRQTFCVNIEFSHAELLRAMWIATELLKGQFGHQVTELSLNPVQTDGFFTIRINDTAVWTRLPGHSPPDYDMIIRPLLSARLGHL